MDALGGILGEIKTWVFGGGDRGGGGGGADGEGKREREDNGEQDPSKRQKLPVALWFFQLGAGNWKRFEPAHERTVEAAWAARENKVRLRTDKFDYDIDLQSFEQKNVRTCRTRKIKRVLEVRFSSLPTLAHGHKQI